MIRLSLIFLIWAGLIAFFVAMVHFLCMRHVDIGPRAMVACLLLMCIVGAGISAKAELG